MCIYVIKYYNCKEFIGLSLYTYIYKSLNRCYISPQSTKKKLILAYAKLKRCRVWAAVNKSPALLTVKTNQNKRDLHKIPNTKNLILFINSFFFLLRGCISLHANSNTVFHCWQIQNHVVTTSDRGQGVYNYTVYALCVQCVLQYECVLLYIQYLVSP